MVEFKKLVPKSETQDRIVHLQEQLTHKQIDGALIMQNSDLYYFSGTNQKACLYVPRQGDPLLMVRENFLWAKSESPIENIVPLKSSKEVLELIKSNGYDLPRFMGMELDVLPTNLFLLRYEDIQQYKQHNLFNIPVIHLAKVKSTTAC
mgnify:CR=1 FL=1